MIRVGIIGTGAISDSHIKAYLEFPKRCTIVAFADSYKDTAREKAARYSLEVDIYENYRDLVKNPDIDLVSICTPPFTHEELTIDFLNAGKHVLVEKPMASSLEECDAMIRAAEENKTILSVVAQNRFRTPMMKLKKTLEAGLIGKVVHVQVDSL